MLNMDNLFSRLKQKQVVITLVNVYPGKTGLKIF